MIEITDTMRMDSFDPNVPHAYDCFIMCTKCGEWLMFDSRVERTMENRHTCENCGGVSFDPQSTTSYRTFDQARAKARSARIKSANKKKGGL